MEEMEYPNEEYEEIEYLDEDFDVKSEILVETTQTSNPATPEPSPDLSQEVKPKRKWPRKKKKSEIKKLYKQYCYKDLMKAVEDVRSGKMTRAEAADEYGVPKKTLAHKVRTFEEEKKDKYIDGKHQKFLDEIKILLRYTTAVPFKSKTSRFYCFYCSMEGPHFVDMDELRVHTRTLHESESERIHLYMRPPWANETIKLDVEDMACRFCTLFFEDWNMMFVHLAEAHYLEFDMAYTNVIPYALTSQLRCFLCSEKFTNFGQLDCHMNSHYTNYICHMCGDTFLCSSRLEKHLLMHKVGEYKCDYCDKVFKLQKYKTKHTNYVHVSDTVKCSYCSEKFHGLYQRHLHVMEEHKDKVTFITCEYCGKTFTWKPYYLAHMRRRHSAVKKYVCDVCQKRFPTKYELNCHMIRHKQEKNFICGLCGEGFIRMVTLKKHAKTHLIDDDDDDDETKYDVVNSM